MHFVEISLLTRRERSAWGPVRRNGNNKFPNPETRVDFIVVPPLWVHHNQRLCFFLDRLFFLFDLLFFWPLC